MSSMFCKIANFSSLFGISTFTVSSHSSSTYFLGFRFVVPFFQIFKHSFLFSNSSLIDLFAVDKPFFPNRFSVFYIFRLSNSHFFSIVVSLPNTFPVLDSFTSFMLGSNWLEREIYDIYGIYFKNNPDIRRILTDYGFEGFPLRKDFPVSGYTQVRYDDSVRRIVLEPVELFQEYRVFDFKSPWAKLY